jgi:hypothetical protein
VDVRVGAPSAPGVVVQGEREREKTVIKERGPVEDKTVIKKENMDGSSEKTIIKHD